jgi:AraC-like DNA-binding protein
MLPNTSHLARNALLLLDYADRHGLDRSSLLQHAGLDADHLSDPDSRIHVASMVKLWRAVIDGSNDSLLGLHVGLSIKTIDLGLLGYTVYYSRDLIDALRRFARFGKILSEAIQFKIVETNTQATLSWQAHPSLVVLKHPVEAGVALIVAVAREITATDLEPISVELPSPEPDTVAAYDSVFRCPVSFGRADGSVTFSRQQMTLPVEASDPTLVGYLDELAAKTIAPLGEHGESTTNAVRRILWSRLPGGRTDLRQAAADMKVSERTLQRRLEEEGSSFSRVLDELRRDLSHELLVDRKLAVSEVAFLLGYSEPSAFQRAFRRWRGVSPRGIRATKTRRIQ